MPVLRKRETLNISDKLRPVNTRPLEGLATARGALANGEAGLGSLRELTATMTRQANTYAQAMGAAAEDEAKALAKAAVFSTGPNGLPQMPPNATARMGEIARKTYDAVMDESFANQMQTAIRGQINDARNANMDDLDGFIADAEGRLSAMALDVPEGFEGMFQQISTGLMVDTGASIGYQQAQIQRQTTAENSAVIAQNVLSGVVERVWAGDDETAQGLIDAEVQRIRAQPDSVVNAADKNKQVDDLYYEVGLKRLMRDAGLGEENNDPAKLAAINEQLQLGADGELMEYFTRPDAGGKPVYDYKMAERAGYKIQELMGAANQRASAATEQNKAIAKRDNALSGYAQDTAENRAALNEGVSEVIQFKDQDGNLRRIMPEDWLTMDGATRQKAMVHIKNAGFADDSLTALFRGLENETDPDTLAAAFSVWRDLRESPNSKQLPVDLSGVVGPKMAAIFGDADRLHGGGGNYDLAVREAVNTSRLIEQQDANKEWDDTRLGTILEVEPAEAKAELGSRVDDEVFDDIQPTSKEREDAIRMTEIQLRKGETPEDAVEFTRQQMEGRYVESPAMGGKRSGYAPEVAYPDPPARTFGAMWEGIKSWSRGQNKAVGEVLMEAPNAIIPNFLGSYSYSFGSDFEKATTFEKIANDQVQTMIEASGMDLETVYGDGVMQRDANGGGQIGPRFLKAGRDFTLEYARRGKGGKPVYRVILKSPFADGTPLDGQFDPTDEMAKAYKMNEVFDMFEDQRKKLGDEAALDLFKGDPEAHELLKFMMESEP